MSNSLINKELMYQKIMPSSLKNKSETIQTNEQVSPRAEPVVSENVADREQKKEFGVRLQSKDEEILVNVMEKLVLDKLEVAFSKFKCCKCDRCKKDVAAITLNSIPSKYVVSSKINLTIVELKQDTTLITTAIVKAILAVRKDPRH